MKIEQRNCILIPGPPVGASRSLQGDKKSRCSAGHSFHCSAQQTAAETPLCVGGTSSPSHTIGSWHVDARDTQPWGESEDFGRIAPLHASVLPAAARSV